jgi:hypothetical protein
MVGNATGGNATGRNATGTLTVETRRADVCAKLHQMREISVAARRRFVQHDIGQGSVDGDVAVVLDEAQVPELGHEKGDPRPGRAD